MNVAWRIDRGFARCGALWQRYPFLGSVLLGFAGMLHPNEMVHLVRRDLIFPRDVAYDMSCMLIHLQNPKTSRFARRQHCRIDDENIILVAEQLFSHLPLEQKLFPGTLATFRRQWNSVLMLLGLPHRQNQRGATPGSLRGSGCVLQGLLRYNNTAWRGRWARTRTLEFYLQEVSAQLLLHELAPANTS